MKKKRRNSGLGCREKNNPSRKKAIRKSIAVSHEVETVIQPPRQRHEQLSTLTDESTCGSLNSWERQKHARIAIAQVFIHSLDCPPKYEDEETFNKISSIFPSFTRRTIAAVVKKKQEKAKQKIKLIQLRESERFL